MPRACTWRGAMRQTAFICSAGSPGGTTGATSRSSTASLAASGCSQRRRPTCSMGCSFGPSMADLRSACFLQATLAIRSSRAVRERGYSRCVPAMTASEALNGARHRVTLQPVIDERHHVANGLYLRQIADWEWSTSPRQLLELHRHKYEVEHVERQVVEAARVRDRFLVLDLQPGRDQVANEHLRVRVHGRYLSVGATGSTRAPSTTSPPGLAMTCSPPTRPSTRSISRPLSRPRTTSTRWTRPAASTVATWTPRASVMTALEGTRTARWADAPAILTSAYMPPRSSPFGLGISISTLSVRSAGSRVPAVRVT